MILTGMVVLSSIRTSLSLLSVVLMVLLLSLPMYVHGVFTGYDSWFYIGLAESIKREGWFSAYTEQASYPSIGFLFIVISRVTGFNIQHAAKISPAVLQIIGLFLVFGISIAAGITKHRAVLPPYVLGSFFGYTVTLEIDYLSFGLILFFLTMYALFLIFNRNYGSMIEFVLVLAVLSFVLIITHPTSAFIFVVAFLMLSVYLIIASSNIAIPSDGLGKVRNIFFLALAVGVGFVMYNLVVGTAYLGIHIINPFVRQTSVIPAPDPFLIKTLDYLPPTSFFESFFTPKNILSWGPVTLLLVIYVSLISYFGFRVIVSRRFLPLNFSVGIVGTVALMRLISGSGLFFFISGPRTTLFSLPFISVAALLCWKEFDGDRQTLITAVLAISLVIFAGMSLVIYPAYFLGEPQSDDVHRYQLTVYEDQQAAYEWVPKGSRTIVASQGSIYLRGMRSEISIGNDRYVWALNRSRLNNERLLMVRPEYKQIIHIRSANHAYKIPEEVYSKYGKTSGYEKVYTTSRVQWYYVRPKDSSTKRQSMR
jgi:hypothetical protein